MPGTYIEYEGQLQSVSYDHLGSEVEEPRFFDRTVRIDCVEDRCVLTGITVGRHDEFPINGSSGEWTFPEEGSPCEEDSYVGASTMTATATAESIAIDVEVAGSDVVQCSPTTSRYRWAVTLTLVATYVSGDPCVLEGSACAVAIAAEPAGDAAPPRTPSTPGVLSTLATPADTLSAAQIALAVGLTLVLVVLMAFPTHLLNGAVEKGADRLKPLIQRVRGFALFTPRAASATGGRARRLPGLLPALAGVVTAALISSFVDPAFGFDPASVRAFASVVVALGVEVVAGWFVVIWAVRRVRPDATPRIAFAPATLLIVLATVIFSRVTGFEPGIVFGLVAAVAFGVSLATAESARAALVGVGFSFVIGILSWLAYTALDGISDASAVVVFARETFAALTIAGVAALPLALVPLRGLTGHDLWSWSRPVWAVAYSIGLLAFFLVLMPLPFSWETVQTSLVSWIGVYLVYAAVALAAWLALTQPWRTTKPEPAGDVSAP